MRIAFTVAPIAFGLDKFFNVLVHWPIYLAPWINDIAPGSGQQFMYFVGVTEIVAGIAVAVKPRYGAYVVAAWLAGIVVNLLTYSGFYDIALRDFGLMLGALGARPPGVGLRPADRRPAPPKAVARLLDHLRWTSSSQVVTGRSRSAPFASWRRAATGPAGSSATRTTSTTSTPSAPRG